MAPRILVGDDNQELLSLLTQLFENAGYEVLAAGRGKQALDLARESPPKLAVLDILLPDTMGYHLADGLRKEQPDLPLLFMTGVFKGGRHALEARQKYASAAYFEKPFEARRLIEAVAAIVPPAKSEAPKPQPQDAFEVEMDVDLEEDAPQEPMVLTGRIRVTGGHELTAELRGADLTARPIAPGEGVSPRPPAEGRIAEVPLQASESAEVAEAMRGQTRRGELKDNLPSLLTAFWLSKETGELGVQKGKVKKVIYFEHGQPVFALSNLLQDRFGQFLVRVGKIRPEQLQDATEVAKQTNRRTGDVLIERGLLQEPERLYFVGQQVKSIIYSLFAWEEGTWFLSFKDRAVGEKIKLDAHPAQLIVRGIKKLWTPERLRRLVTPEDRPVRSPKPDYDLQEVELERWESQLLPRIDGTRTVAELGALAGRPEHVVNGFFAAMYALQLLEPRPSE